MYNSATFIPISLEHKQGHTCENWSEKGGIWTYVGPKMSYRYHENGREKKTLTIEKDSKQIILNGREILELAKIF